VAKFYLFRTVIAGDYIGLALVGVLTSLISAYYYLRVVVIMYMQDGDPEIQREPWLGLTTGVAAVGTVVLSLAALPLINWASQAVLRLF
jgi:NADH-quinone oxidoreductase subunit N